MGEVIKMEADINELETNQEKKKETYKVSMK